MIHVRGFFQMLVFCGLLSVTGVGLDVYPPDVPTEEEPAGLKGDGSAGEPTDGAAEVWEVWDTGWKADDPVEEGTAAGAGSSFTETVEIEEDNDSLTQKECR